MDIVSYVSRVVVVVDSPGFSVKHGGSSIIHLDPQHSISLQPDSVAVWMKLVIATLIASMMDAMAVIIVVIVMYEYIYTPHTISDAHTQTHI